MMVGGLMAGILTPIYKTSITTHVEISCLDYVVACAIVGFSSLYVSLPLVAPAFAGFSNGRVYPALLVLVK